MDVAQLLSVMSEIMMPLASSPHKEVKEGRMEGRKQRAAMGFLIDFLLKLEILLERGSRSR